MAKIPWETVEFVIRLQNWNKEQEEGEFLDNMYASAWSNYENGLLVVARDLFALLKDLIMVGLSIGNDSTLTLAKVWFGLGATLHKANKFDVAQKCYLYAFFLNQADLSPVFWVVECLVRLGDNKKARECLEFIIQTEKENVEQGELVEKAEILLSQLPKGEKNVGE